MARKWEIYYLLSVLETPKTSSRLWFQVKVGRTMVENHSTIVPVTSACHGSRREGTIRITAKTEEEGRKKKEIGLFTDVQVAQNVPFGVGAYGLRVCFQSGFDDTTSRSGECTMRVLQG